MKEYTREEVLVIMCAFADEVRGLPVDNELRDETLAQAAYALYSIQEELELMRAERESEQ